MEKKSLKNLTFTIAFLTILVLNVGVYAQQSGQGTAKSEFWKNVQFGGGLGLSFGNFTNITVAPAAIYNVNDYVSAGVGLLGSYVAARDSYKSTILGGSLISLFNPIKEIQLSIEIEQVHVNAVQQYSTIPLGMNGNYDPMQSGSGYELKNNFWTTALFVGGGYNTGNVTVGGRYNLLFDKNKSAYSAAFIPFVRVFF